MLKTLRSILTISIILVSTPIIYAQDSNKSVILSISVNDVKALAITNNLDVKLAQLDSKIKGTELSYKEAIFDTILSGEIDYTNDQRKRSSTLYGTKNLINNYNIGIDKKLKSGTDIEIDFTNKREWTNSSFVSTNPYHESQVEISLRQPIAKNFFGLIDRGTIELVKEEIKNTNLYSYINIENAVVSSEKSYWALVLAREEYFVKKELLKKAIRLFNQYRYKLKIGMVESGEVLAAEANMHSRKSSLRIARNDILSAEELLKLKLNLDKEVCIIPLDRLNEKDFSDSFENCLKTAFEHRRDYLASKNDIEAKNITLKMKSNSLFPQIDLLATFARNGINRKYYKSIEDLTKRSNAEYYVGLELTLSLENNQAKSEYETAQLDKMKAVINLQKIERRIILDINNAYRELRLAKTNLATMERIENLQRGKLIQEEKRFKYGRSNSDLLIRYQEDLLNAMLAKKKSYYDYLISIINLMDSEDIYLKNANLE